MNQSIFVNTESDIDDMFYVAVPVAFSGQVFGFKTQAERDSFLIEARIKTPGAFSVSAEVFAAVHESTSQTKH